MTSTSTAGKAPKKAYDTWTVLEHGPIDKVAGNLWMVQGALPNMPLPRWMAIARMNDGGLVIHNAIALGEEAMKEIDAWGTPAFIVVPNGWHRLDCVAWKKRYPGARVVCPAGSRKKVEEVVAVDLVYDEFPGDEAVSLAPLAGLAGVEGVMKVRSAEGVTLVFNDLVFNLAHQRGFFGLVFRLMGSTGGPRVTRLFRLFAVKDKKAVRAEIEALAGTADLVRVVPGHGEVINADPASVLSGIAARL